MAGVIVTDPTLLLAGNSDAAATTGAELAIDTVAKTIQIIPNAGDIVGLDGGVTFQALYSAFKLLWRNSSTYIKYPFPFESITPEQFEVINGWSFLDTTTRKAIRSAGWVERNSTGNILKMFAGIVSLGSLGSTDQPYYQQGSTEAAVNFTFQGSVNEAIQILDDPNGDGSYVDGYDKRSYLKLFAREYQKSYASAQLSDIGVTTNMNYIVYRFPLSNASDLKVTLSDGVISGATYTDVDITYFGTDQNRNIGGSNYPFRIIIDGNNKTAEEIYQKIQYLLRQDSDIDTAAGVVNGKTADSLLRFIGDTLVTSTGVYIDNFNTNDTNRIQFFDKNGVQRVFPFVATGSLSFNQNLVNDTNAKYWLFFTTLPAADSDFGESSATIVNDASGTPIQGNVSGQPSITFTFAYDSNVQGGRTAGTNANVTAVAIGTNGAQYVLATGTLQRTTGQNFSLVSPLERNYLNP